MGGDFLEGWAIGTAIAYRAPAAVQNVQPVDISMHTTGIANAPAYYSGLEQGKYQSQQEVRQAQEETQDFRRYASRLEVNLKARKMSESVLLKALKEENINHPLATEAGFEALFQKMIADQYGLIDSPESGNRYVDKNGNQQFRSLDQTSANKEAMLKAEEISTEAGRRAVG